MHGFARAQPVTVGEVTPSAAINAGAVSYGQRSEGIGEVGAAWEADLVLGVALDA